MVGDQKAGGQEIRLQVLGGAKRLGLLLYGSDSTPTSTLPTLHGQELLLGDAEALVTYEELFS